MNKTGKLKKLIICLLITVVSVSTFPTENAFAYLKSAEKVSKKTSFVSTNNKNYERLECNVVSNTNLEITYQTLIPSDRFKISLYHVSGITSKQGDIGLQKTAKAKTKKNKFGDELYTFKKIIDLKELKVPTGYYNLYITRGYTEIVGSNTNYTYDDVGVAYKNLEIHVKKDKKNSNVYICNYNEVVDYNNDLMKIGKKYPTSKYLDQSLEDIKFVLRNPATDIYATMTPEKIAYMKTISDRICFGETSKYRMLMRIYEYVASNFYYDSVAFSTHSYQYADPYQNVYNFENGKTSENSKDGKVYTTCQGFSAIMVSFARAQGIPTRFVYGHRLSVPNLDWRTEDDIDVRDHWWLEANIDNRWIFVDPTVGTGNKYNKNKDIWVETGLTNYTYFDPTKEQIATSHVYMNIYPDYRYAKYLTNTYEEEKIKSFLDTIESVDGSYSYYGSMNRGKLLDSFYSPSDKETWGDGIKSHFMTDGKGNVEQIQWSNKGFTRELSLPNFSHLVKLSMRNNKFTSADVSGTPKLRYLYLDKNPLTYAAYTYNKKDRSITATGHGTFGFILNLDNRNPLTIYSKPDLGYKIGGIINTASGKSLSKKKTYSFKPLCLNLEIRFVPDPDSYKYYLTPTSDYTGSRVKYLQAAAKRLNELGYYTPYIGANTIGQETYLTKDIQEAAIKFQIVHDLENTGNIGQGTWEILFSNKAKSMPSYEEYQTIKSNYEMKKYLEEQARLEAERLAKEKAEQELLLAEQKAAEEKLLAEQKAAEEKLLAEQKAAEKAKKSEEEKLAKLAKEALEAKETVEE